VAQLDGTAPRARRRGFLNDFEGLLHENLAEARPLLDLALADRIGFNPLNPDKGRDHFEQIVPLAFDRVMTAAIPELRRLQDRVASPTRIAIGWKRAFPVLRPDFDAVESRPAAGKCTPRLVYRPSQPPLLKRAAGGVNHGIS
jgi:hypothetical protein